MELPVNICKRKLASVWFLGAAILFLLVFLQTIFGKYGAKDADVWAWALQTIMPTLTLIVSVLLIDSHQNPAKSKKVDSFYFRTSLYFSYAYFFIVLLTILLQPIALSYGQITPLELIKKSGLWLGPLQGLTAGAVGIFFVKGKS